MTLRVPQLVVNSRVHEIGIGVARRAAFQHDYRQAGLGKLFGENASGPTEPDNDDVSGFKFHCHDRARSAQVLDRFRFDVKAFVAIFLDDLAIHPDSARKADHLPYRAIAIASVDRVGKISFHGVLKQYAEEGARWNLGK